MANTDRHGGFRPVKYLNGAPWNGQARKYIVEAGDSTAVFVGDFVVLSNEAATTEYPAVEAAAASVPLLGVVVGFQPVTTTFEDGSSTGHGSMSLDTPLYRAADVKRIALVADDPNLLFEGQEDGAVDPLEKTDVGLNVNIIVAAGSTTTGQSGMEIDSSTHATTSTLPLKLMGLVNRPDNEYISGGQAYTRWLVKINNHQLNSVGTVGA